MPRVQWNVGAGYSAADFQAAVFLNDASVVTGRLAHSVSGTATIGAEVAHSLPDKSTTFSAGEQLVGCHCVALSQLSVQPLV